jgi:hypothetical protein
MFVVDRSALAVLLPLALLVGAVLWSNRPTVELQARDKGQERAQTVAANLPSR